MLSSARTVLLTLLFYCFSMSLTFFNNRSIKMFPYPLSITFLHMCSKFLISWIAREWTSWYYRLNRRELSWSMYVRTVAIAGLLIRLGCVFYLNIQTYSCPINTVVVRYCHLNPSSLGTTSALDIGFSNWSFEFITISLYTMTKSTSVIFILMFSILFRLERKRVSLIFVILLISCGLFMFSYESAQFNVIGFSLVLVASFLSGIRWTTTQLLTQKKEWGLSHPIDLIYHIQPWMALSILPLSLYIESSELISSKNFFRTDDYGQLVRDLLFVSMGGLLAFGLECSEYLVVSTASCLTLSVAGIFKSVPYINSYHCLPPPLLMSTHFLLISIPFKKEVCTLYLAAKFNGDQISSVNLLGFLLCILGILLHVFLKTTTHCELPTYQST
ncbi:solute carrier family 35, member C2 [Paragonimus westermani]|uniref:Solute carrier family 35, member C2 n=1 Tax=Paragonimus westermani TaxID=34504 RepID=A0A5J4NU63_9TREM|nr:solute carrier family 35, member C2 [Paragonimus westermani]